MDEFFLDNTDTMINDVFVQFGIGRESDVFLLNSSIHQYFLFLCSFPMNLNGYLKGLFCPVFTDPLSKVHQIGGLAWEVPLKRSLSTKKLKIGIFNPAIYHRFI